MDNREKMMLNELSSQDLFQNDSYETDKELLVLYIEICENNTQVLTVHESDNTEQIVNDFCQKQNIGPNAQAYLLEEVEKSLAYYYPPVQSHLPDSIDQELTNDEIKFEEHNKGTELYVKGQKLRERAEKKREKIRTERSQKESENATFKPRVNSPLRRPRPPEQYLAEKGKQTVESLNKKRNELEHKMMEECSFSPVINKNSGNMQKSLMRSPDRFSSLYKDAKSIQDKLLKKSEELNKMFCPFEPNFGMTKKKTQELLDKPSRCSTQERRDSEFRIVYEKNAESPKKQESPKKVTERSEQMIKKIKKQRFEEIFIELLPDTKGKIFKETIYKSRLDSKVKLIILPILEKIESNDQALNLQEFIEEMEDLFKNLPQIDKSTLLKTGKKRLEGEELYKKPKHKRPNSCASFYKDSYEESFSPHKYY